MYFDNKVIEKSEAGFYLDVVTKSNQINDCFTIALSYTNSNGCGHLRPLAIQQ
jgi:hypothetical protein